MKFHWFKPKEIPSGLAQRYESTQKKLELAEKLLKKYGNRRMENHPVPVDRRRIDTGGHYELAHQ